MIPIRCQLNDLPVDGCAHCRGVIDTAVDDVSVRITARYPGYCAACSRVLAAGEVIGYSDDAGGWVGSCCDRGPSS